MSKPTEYTAAELAEALKSYGDMPIAVMVVDDDNQEIGPVRPLRLEIGTRFSSHRYVAITAYMPDGSEENE